MKYNKNCASLHPRYEYPADGKVISEKRGVWEKKYEYAMMHRTTAILRRLRGE